MTVRSFSGAMAAISALALSAPAAAAPKEQIGCIKDETPPEVLRGMVMESAYNLPVEYDGDAMERAASVCQERYGWTDTDAMNAGRYALTAFVVEISGTQLAEKGVDVAMINGFLAKEYPAMRAAGSIENYDRNAIDAVMVAAGIDTENESSALDGLLYVLFGYWMRQLEEDFEAGVLAD